MATRDYISRYLGDPMTEVQLPGRRDPRQAHEDYRELHEEGSLLDTLATAAVTAGGVYLLGRSLPRDTLRHILHSVGELGRGAKSLGRDLAQSARAEFAERVGREAPHALEPARYPKLDLVRDLEQVFEMRGHMGVDRFGNVRRGVRPTGTRTVGEVVGSELQTTYGVSPEAGRLQYLTVGDILGDRALQQQVGESQFQVLREAQQLGLIRDKFAVSPGEFGGLFKDPTGRVIDSRWIKPRNIFGAVHQVARQIQIPILNQRPADWVANLMRPIFSEGRFFTELGGGLPIGPGRRLQSVGYAFGIGGKIFEEEAKRPGFFREVAKGFKFFDAAEAGNLIPQAVEARFGMHALQSHRVLFTQGEGALPWARRVGQKAQELTGIGPQFRTREHVLQSMVIDPLRRRRALREGGRFVPFGPEAGIPGFGWIPQSAQRRPLIEQMFHALSGVEAPSAAAVYNAPGVATAPWWWRGAAKHFDVPGGAEGARALFGLEERGTILSEQGFRNFRRLGRIRPQDLAVHKRRYFPRLGRRRVTARDTDQAAASLGSLTRTRKVKGFAVPTGAGETTSLVGNYFTLRLNDLLSATLGFGFRPGAGKTGWLLNTARIYGGYLGIRMGVEALDYADYLAEDVTGVSPKKAALQTYSLARVGMQQLRELTGLAPAARYAEDLLPGSVDSPLSQAARFAYPVARGILGRGRFGVGLAAGTFLGYGDIAKDPGQLRKEHTGEELVPYRRGRWWMLGRQPFTGGQIDYYGPSWVARQLSDYQYTDVLYGSRQEYFKYQSILPTPTNLFGLSRDTGHVERKHLLDRPYPISTAGDTTRVVEMISTHPTTEPDIQPGVAGKLGYPPFERGPLEMQEPDRFKNAVDYITQMGGIWKFGLWDLAGFADPLDKRGQLATADAMTSHSRSFYDEQLGGMVGMTEMYRRFVPDEKEIYRLNKIPNTMPDWMPGIRSVFERDKSYYIDFSTGDPYTKIRHGEARLPGGGYDRLHRLHSGTTGVYDAMDRFLILADVAPYSHAFRHYQTLVQSWMKAGVLDAYWRQKLETTQKQVKDKLQVHEFQPRRFTGMIDSSEQQTRIAEQYNFLERAVGGLWEVGTHDVVPTVGKVLPILGPILGDKLMPVRSPVETYAKWELYGEDFADWRTPYKSFLRPKMHELVASDPATAGFGGAMLGMFGANPLAKLFIGGAGAVGLGASSTARVISTGRLTGGYVPEHREEERLLKEYLDKLEYVKLRRLQIRAETRGERYLARDYEKQAGRTVTGLDYSLPYHYFINQARAALDKRERSYFDAFVNVEDRETRDEIISMVPSYVQPIYQAAWSKMGDPRAHKAARVAQMTADERAAEFFRTAPLPRSDWAGWHPSVPMSAIRVKAVDSAESNTALDKHRFNLWGPQSELAYREYPELDVPVVDLGAMRRLSNERQVFMDSIHQQGAEMTSTWEGSLSADTVSWEVVDNYTRRAMSYAGSILG